MVKIKFELIMRVRTAVGSGDAVFVPSRSVPVDQ